MPITYFTTWAEALSASFQLIWFRFASFVPQLVAAIVILLLGFILASVVSVLVRKVVQFTNIDQSLQRLEVTHTLERRGLRLRLADTLAWMVKWFILILVLITVSDSLGLSQVTLFLQDVVRYIPQVITAVIMLTIGFVAAGFVQRLVVDGVTASRFPTSSANFLGAIAKWSITVFAFMAALIQLGVAANLLQIFFTGFIAMVALAGGLAFGLGGREQAADLLASWSKEMGGRPNRESV